VQRALVPGADAASQAVWAPASGGDDARHAGAPSPDDYSHEAYGRITADLVEATGADVVVGFSMGANVALEMTERKLFSGPTVLLGGLPLALMKRAVGSMVKRLPVPPERQAELAGDFRRNSTRDMRLGLLEYLKWLESGEDHAAMLCRSGVPTWVVPAEKGGDGGLTDSERRTLDACSTIKIVTIPGSVFFLPNEVPDQIASVINDAVAAVNT
jgi:pimeloyl-ACP methyl ester carboxylesterase